MNLLTKIINLLTNLSFRRIPKPPYKHVVQLGDPVLRSKCRLVKKEELHNAEMIKLLNMMQKVMKRYKCVGISAPQVGIDLRVFAMTFPSLYDFAGSPQEYQLKAMKAHPYCVWINPSMKVLDYSKVKYSEGCESMRGFCAEVPRYTKVHLTGWNEDGVEKAEEFSGWLARIVQHEMDHLEGRLFLELADVSSLACTFWDRVNYTGGRIHMSYYPNKILSKG